MNIKEFFKPTGGKFILFLILFFLDVVLILPYFRVSICSGITCYNKIILTPFILISIFLIILNYVLACIISYIYSNFAAKGQRESVINQATYQRPKIRKPRFSWKDFFKLNRIKIYLTISFTWLALIVSHIWYLQNRPTHFMPLMIKFFLFLILSYILTCLIIYVINSYFRIDWDYILKRTRRKIVFMLIIFIFFMPAYLKPLSPSYSLLIPLLHIFKNVGVFLSVSLYKLFPLFLIQPGVWGAIFPSYLISCTLIYVYEKYRGKK